MGNKKAIRYKSINLAGSDNPTNICINANAKDCNQENTVIIQIEWYSIVKADLGIFIYQGD